VRRSSSNSSLQKSVLRGPPRKPKQSGHALWVGNLPPATHIIDLKDHFSRDATDDIESVFLISKSNCAFVNYKTETSCTAAMSRFHDSRFQGVRLVCRLRRGSISTSASQSITKPVNESPGEGETSPDGDDGALTDGEVKASSDTDAEVVEKVKEKFFVVKSLTVDDLERSVHSGVWATQAHNETALNKAFHVGAQSTGICGWANWESRQLKTCI
jgi:RNA recognition motif-containing protein